MRDILTKDGCFKYKWHDNYFGKKGCDICNLRNDEYCPSDCDKNGCYIILSFDEMKSERIRERMNKSGLIDRWTKRYKK